MVQSFKFTFIFATWWFRFLPYFLLNAVNSNLLLFWSTMHMSLKHSAISLFPTFNIGCSLVSIFILSTFSLRLRAAITIVRGVYFLPSPSNKAVSMAYLQKLTAFSIFVLIVSDF